MMTALTSSRTASAPTGLAINDHTIETIKWVAAIAMTLDHVNKYLANQAYPVMFAIGRVALPLFAIALALNLVRSGTLENGVFTRTAMRLVLFGVLATVPFELLGGAIANGWPANILFSLLVAVAVMWLISLGGFWRAVLAPAVFVIGGAAAEFWWAAPAIAVGTWLFVRGGRVSGLLLIAGGFGGLQMINGNGWALASLPIFYLASIAPLATPRLGRFFYWYYVTHLATLVGLKALIP